MRTLQIDKDDLQVSDKTDFSSLNYVLNQKLYEALGLFINSSNLINKNTKNIQLRNRREFHFHQNTNNSFAINSLSRLFINHLEQRFPLSKDISFVDNFVIYSNNNSFKIKFPIDSINLISGYKFFKESPEYNNYSNYLLNKVNYSIKVYNKIVQYLLRIQKSLISNKIPASISISLSFRRETKAISDATKSYSNLTFLNSELDKMYSALESDEACLPAINCDITISIDAVNGYFEKNSLREPEEFFERKKPHIKANIQAFKSSISAKIINLTETLIKYNFKHKSIIPLSEFIKYHLNPPDTGHSLEWVIGENLSPVDDASTILREFGLNNVVAPLTAVELPSHIGTGISRGVTFNLKVNDLSKKVQKITDQHIDQLLDHHYPSGICLLYLDELSKMITTLSRLSDNGHFQFINVV